ncbi:hypothetical protein MBLNU13_g06162t1 [Cladosporium sp. NU13]
MDLASLLRDILDDARYDDLRELAAGDPATHPSIPPKDGACLWNLLPRELRDSIFEYACGTRSGALKILFKSHIDLVKECDKSTRLRSRGSRKQWASEAAQAMFSTTELRFEHYILRTFFPRTCLDMAGLYTLNLDMRDLARVAKHLPMLCPRLRRIRISATYFGVWVCETGGKAALYSSKWTRAMIRSSNWFRAIRPLNGLEKVSVNFPKVGLFLDNCIYSLNEQDNIRTNTALVQSLVKQSATQPREASSSGAGRDET